MFQPKTGFQAQIRFGIKIGFWSLIRPSSQMGCSCKSDFDPKSDCDPKSNFEPKSDFDSESDLHPGTDFGPASDFDTNRDFAPKLDVDPPPWEGVGGRLLYTYTKLSIPIRYNATPKAHALLGHEIGGIDPHRARSPPHCDRNSQLPFRCSFFPNQKWHS